MLQWQRSRVCSFGSLKMIHGVKDDPIHQVSCQGPSTSFKYPHKGQKVLDTLLIMLECQNFAHRSGIVYQKQLWGQGWSMSSMSLVRNHQCPPSHWWWQGPSWHTFTHARKLKFGSQVSNHIWRTFEMSKMTDVLIVSSQKPSKSSKSLMMIWRFLTHFYSCSKA